MANKGIVAAGVGVGAGLLMMAVYAGAPLLGIQVSSTAITTMAAVAAFCASVALLTFTALQHPGEKKPAQSRKLGDLDKKAFARFPTGAVKLVLKPDSIIEEWDIVQSASARESYADKDIILFIKKSKAKQPFNPSVMKKLFGKLQLFQGFVHIVLVNEHDEFVGYIPAAYARLNLAKDGAEAVIVKYIVDVLTNPDSGIVLREIRGFSRHDTIFDHMTVRDAQRKVTDDHLYGLVVLREKRNRKPLGVIYEEDLVKLTLEEIDRLH
jgi:hypothetical protein